MRKRSTWKEFTGGKEARKFFKKFAVKGWLAPNWPKAYGGLESSNMLAYMIRDEMPYLDLPMDFTGVHRASPTIMHFGSEEMKKEFLPPIARGKYN